MMNCTACGGETQVIYARKHRTETAAVMVKRVRRCISCGVRFSTYERVVDGTEDLVITDQRKAQEGQDAAPGQAQQGQDAAQEQAQQGQEETQGKADDQRDPDERDAENFARLFKFVKTLLIRPSLVIAEGQPAGPPGGREHHLAVRDAG